MNQPATPAPRLSAGHYLVEEPRLALPPPSHWLWATCLIGVDYFSTLAYQVSFTFQTAGRVAPLATLVVVGMTLAGALPVYLYIAGRSPKGESSIALVEQLVRGWLGKSLVLVLLGFAATDFVITKTLSTAAAARHVISNPSPSWQRAVDRIVAPVQQAAEAALGPEAGQHLSRQLLITILLGGLSFTFWALIRRGFNRKATLGAVLVVGTYLALNALVVGSGLVYIAQHPDLVTRWLAQLESGEWHTPHAPLPGHGPWALLLTCLWLFPKLSLGLSGLEMSIVAMPEVQGRADEDAVLPSTRIRNTRKVMVAAALVMCLYLTTSVFVTTLLVPEQEFLPGGEAADRALAYLAHGGTLATGEAGRQLLPWFGNRFGAAYDLVTIAILCLAGTSVITGLTTLLPQFLLRFGMQFKWVHTWGILFAIFAAVNLAVTVLFHASVADQRGAYATGVLVLITNAAVVTVADRWRNRRGRGIRDIPFGYALAGIAFALTTLAVVVAQPSGLLISVVFIAVILGSSIVSRAVRSGELRTIGFEVQDDDSKLLWDRVRQLELPVLVPHRPGLFARQQKAESLRREHQLAADAELVFLEVHVDDPSNFYQRLRMRVFMEDHRYVMQIQGCVSVAHAIAAVALELGHGGNPPPLHFGWPEMSLLEESWSFLAFGEGNVPWKVRELIRLAEPDSARRPRVVIG
jgi:hypothetical protein